MNTPNDGGPAFPMPCHHDPIAGAWHPFQAGMTLRDYFAGQAMAGMFSNHKCCEKGTQWIVDHALIAADAMLAARATGKGVEG